MRRIDFKEVPQAHGYFAFHCETGGYVAYEEAELIERERDAQALLAAKYREAGKAVLVEAIEGPGEDYRNAMKNLEQALSLTPTAAMQRVKALEDVAEAAGNIKGGNWNGSDELGALTDKLAESLQRLAALESKGDA